MKRRAIYNLLAIAVLVTTFGADYLASAGVSVRAEAVVSVAERMANRFARAFPRREQHRPAVQLARLTQAVRVAFVRPVWPQNAPHPTPVAGAQLLYLPPPQA